MSSNSKKPDHVSARPHIPKSLAAAESYWGKVLDRSSSFSLDERTAATQGKYCSKPFTWFEVQIDGRVFLCCPTWLPYPVGNIFDNTIAEVWNSERVVKIRESIYDGSFRYCNKPLCPEIQSNFLKRLDTVDEQDRWTLDPTGFPKNINFSTDESCNLSCPSCRTDKILHGHGAEYDHRKALDDRIWNEILARPRDIDINIHITGSGDPFGSKIFRERLLSLDATDRPNMKFYLRTNGVMMTPKIWNQLNRIESNIKNIHISFDAANKSTYDITRRGGDWDTLIENVKYIDPIARRLGIQLFYDFVVQDINAFEMLEFCELVNSISPNYYLIHFTRVSDWGTWDRENFMKRAIWMNTHEKHAEWLEYISDKRFDNYRISWSNMAQFRKTAIETR